MNYLLPLPDFIAMTLLVGVLLLVRSKRSDGIIRMWTAGLLLILLECAARIVYGMQTSRAVHMVSHSTALDSYGLAGAIFLRSASRTLRRMPAGMLFLWTSVLPHLALFTVYGFDVKAAWVYRSITLAGLFVGLGMSAWLRRTWSFYVAFAGVWLPLMVCTWWQQYRTAIYLDLFFIYALSAVCFGYSLRRGSRGKIAVVAGFSMWALCFATHPWIASFHPGWVDFANEFWNMQKFIITVGLLLVMLEDQIRNNEWLALHDGLTGLPNRRLFEDRLQHALLHAERTRSRLAVFSLDLDGFKQVNDTLGHDAGDIVLKAVSKSLIQSIRRSDTLARLGGDEFALVAADLDGALGGAAHTPATGRSCMAAQLPQVLRILSKMVAAVESPVNLGEVYDGRNVKISASIGVVIYPDEGINAEELMRLADQRMYQSKSDNTKKRRQSADQAAADYDLQRA